MKAKSLAGGEEYQGLAIGGEVDDYGMISPKSPRL